MSNDADTWHHRFDTILHNPYGMTDTLLQQMYDSGMQLIRQIPNDDPESRELVLQKLMILFPKQHELLYYMGWIWKDINFFKAAAWFQQCLNVDPKNIENVIDYTKLLFDNRYTNYIQHINDTNQNILYGSNDPRAIVTAGAMLIKQRQFVAAERLFGKIFAEIKRGDVVVDAKLLCSIYLCMDSICKHKLHIDKAMQYLFKALALPLNAVGLINVQSVFHSLMLTYDYQYHSSSDRMDLCKKYAELLHSPVDETQIFPPRPVAVVPGKRIRIGYVSSGFYKSVISNFITAIIQHHNPVEFEVYVFTHLHYAAVAAMYRPWSGHIHVYDIQHLSDYDVAAFVRQQQVDILVDLQGYTDVPRIGIFCYRAAPVQMTYIGFPNSLGLSPETMTYRITDAVADSMNSTQIYTEQRLYMPRCFLLYTGDIGRSQRPTNGSVIFGALNKELKNSMACLECWRKILAQVPDSKLLIKLCAVDIDDEKLKYYMDALHLEDPGRLKLVSYTATEEEYARLFNCIDILLDTFPYSGTTTTCNAMSASIPVITLYNPNYHAHNVSASILAHSGFGELIAYTDNEYVTKAVELARSTSQLQSYKARIRDGFNKLMNPAEFMRCYEGLMKQAYVTEAKRWVEED